MRDKNAQPVALDAFMKWMETTMGIRGLSHPSHIIETEDGDLILDPRLQGKIYLKGMLHTASASTHVCSKEKGTLERSSHADRSMLMVSSR
ncbi:hypothetical protein N7467_002322 [Penicillium canescens]|nr:hypothetical protein N7467_002322 [Penicillium canescens]